MSGLKAKIENLDGDAHGLLSLAQQIFSETGDITLAGSVISAGLLRCSVSLDELVRLARAEFKESTLRRALKQVESVELHARRTTVLAGLILGMEPKETIQKTELLSEADLQTRLLELGLDSLRDLAESVK